MPTVRFEDRGDVQVEAGDTLLDAAWDAGVPMGSDCGGNCACGTCHVYIVEGSELLRPLSEEEQDVLDFTEDVEPNSRLACQCEVRGSGRVVVQISKESQDTYHLSEGQPGRGPATRLPVV